MAVVLLRVLAAVTVASAAVPPPRAAPDAASSSPFPEDLRLAHVVLLGLVVVCGLVGSFRGRELYGVAKEIAVSGHTHNVSGHMVRLGAFTLLVVLQSTAILLFKACQLEGLYTFSPASSIAITEFAKFAMASYLHSRHVAMSGSKAWFDGVNRTVVLNYAGLAALYTANNYITFHVHVIADPGSYTLGKSITPYLVALLLRLTGERLHELQWVCIVVQCASIAITQYDPCSAATILPARAYHLIALSACITATCGVWNQKVIKGFAVPVNCQNMILYTFGGVLATSAFFANPGADDKSFFEGYTALPLALVGSQAFQGLAVTFVLKYADVIVKNFAGSAVMAILVVVSANFFGLHTTLVTWLGLLIVLTITYTYLQIATKVLPMPKPAAATAEQPKGLDAPLKLASDVEKATAA